MKHRGGQLWNPARPKLTGWGPGRALRAAVEGTCRLEQLCGPRSPAVDAKDLGARRRPPAGASNLHLASRCRPSTLEGNMRQEASSRGPHVSTGAPTEHAHGRQHSLPARSRFDARPYATRNTFAIVRPPPGPTGALLESTP